MLSDTGHRPVEELLRKLPHSRRSPRKGCDPHPVELLFLSCSLLILRGSNLWLVRTLIPSLTRNPTVVTGLLHVSKGVRISMHWPESKDTCSQASAHFPCTPHHLCAQSQYLINPHSFVRVFCTHTYPLLLSTGMSFK